MRAESAATDCALTDVDAQKTTASAAARTRSLESLPLKLRLSVIPVRQQSSRVTQSRKERRRE